MHVWARHMLNHLNVGISADIAWNADLAFQAVQATLMTLLVLLKGVQKLSNWHRESEP